MERIPRRWVDHLTSLVVPTRRYRCHAVGCAWEGNLRSGMDSSVGERRRYERRIDAP